MTIEDPKIFLKPRAHYKDQFTLDMKETKIWNTLEMRNGRWLHHPAEAILCSIFHLDSQISIIYNGKTKISDPVSILIDYENPNIDSLDYNAHDPKVLDQSTKIKLQLTNFKIALNQIHYNFLLQCLDLNVNYSDTLDSLFNFAQIQYHEIEGTKFWKSVFIFLKGEASLEYL